MTSDPRSGPASPDVVEAMLDALRSSDIDTAANYFDDAIVWHNVGLPPVRGKKRVARALGPLAGPHGGFEVTVHNVATEGDTVLTERTDVIVWRRLRVEFWVCGTFTVRDGRITLWRDYFDRVAVVTAVVRGVACAVTRRPIEARRSPNYPTA